MLKRPKGWRVRGQKEPKRWKKAERWKVKGRKSLKWLQTCCSRSRDKVENVPIRNEWENASQTPAIFEKTVIVIAKIFTCWVTGDIAECTHVVYISVECIMRAQERQTKQVPSALLQKFGLKINIAACGGDVGVLVALGLLNPKP